MLDGPHGIEAERIRQRDLLEAVVVNGFLGLTSPRSRHGNFIEQAKFHGVSPPLDGAPTNRSFSASGGQVKVPRKPKRSSLAEIQDSAHIRAACKFVINIQIA